jgi:beta-glucosidase
MVDVTPETTSVDAILEAGYPGVGGAQAIADTLFGANDHLGGKLSYTLYHASYVNDIAMSEMEMDVGVGRSYRYYNGSEAPLFPFGHGLSLTPFSLDLASGPGAQVSIPTEAAPSRNFSFSLTVTNTGASTTGDEVIFAWFAPVPGSLSAQPANRLIKQLFDFERVHLGPGQSQTLDFTASSETLRLVDKATGDVVSTPGAFDIIFSNGVDNVVVATRVTVTGSEIVVTPFPSI